MNENKSNWAERATLASSIFTNVQLRELQATLQTLGALHAEQVRLGLNEQQKTEREDRLREGLWQLEKAFDNLVGDAAVTPCATHLMAVQAQEIMARFCLTTESFRQLADKDRVGQFAARLRQAAEDAAGKLTPDQRAEMVTYVQYCNEASALNGLINRLRAEADQKETQLVRTNGEKVVALDKLKNLKLRLGSAGEKQAKAECKRRWLLATFGLIAAWASAVFLYVVSFRHVADDTFSNLDAVFLVLGLLVLLAAIVGTSRYRRKWLQMEKPLAEQIAACEDIVKKAEAWIVELNQPQAAANELSVFGVKDLDELVQCQQHREAFMLNFRHANGLGERNDFSERSKIMQESGSADFAGTTLSIEVQELARQPHKKISAIQLYQRQSGVSLAEAKNTIETYYASRTGG